jgi:tRNA(Ile)-lysidine synthase
VLSSLAPALLERCRFPPPGTAIACAVSGGPDSLALLALAVAAGCRATAYHVDHGLRPESAAEADVVKVQAEALGAGFVALEVECPAGPNLEARARTARFSVLPADVATGHTADDQAETVLLNLLRGAAGDGLAGMRPSARHPLLALRRAETEALSRSLQVPIVRDPSNESPAHRRNRVRAELLPLAGDIARRDLVPVLVRQAELLAEEGALLDALAAEIDVTSAAALRSAPVALARRAVRTWLRAALGSAHPLDAAATERVLAVARGAVLACELPGGGRVSRSRGRLLVVAPVPRSDPGQPE